MREVETRWSVADSKNLGSWALLILVLLLGGTGSALAEPADYGFQVELRPSVQATPSPPSRGVFAQQLVLDDGSAEGIFGANRQFLFFNSFANPGGMSLEEIWVLFPSGGDVSVGADVQLLVYLDPDSDPTNGATLLGSYDVTVQAANGSTFSIYPLASPVGIGGTGDILIGVVNRYFETGVDPAPSQPAALDTTASQSRSYIALWAGDPPAVPDLATASTIDLLAGASAGNLMIRGFGSATVGAGIPTLGGFGLGLLVTLIAAAGIILQRIAAGRV